MIARRLIADNFNRYEHFELDLDQGGLVLVSGENGTGKTSLFDALSWCLYGVTLNDQRGDEVLNPIIKKNCCVRLEIEDTDCGELVVERYRKHDVYSNNLYFRLSTEEKSDKPLEGWSTDSTQERINKYFGMDFKLFTNSVIFAQGHSKFFASLGDSDQKALLESFVDSLIYNEAYKKTQEREKRVGVDVLTWTTKKSGIIAKIRDLEGDIERYQERFEHFEESRVKQVKDLEEEFKVLCRESHVLDRKLQGGEQELAAWKHKIEGLKDDISRSRCEKCLQPLPSGYEKDYQFALSEARALEQLLAQVNFKRASISREKDRIAEKIVEVQEAENTYNEIVSDMMAQLQRAEVELVEIEKTLQALEVEKSYVEFWLEGYGPRGIISYLFDPIIPSVNVWLEKYSRILSDGEIYIYLEPDTKLKSGQSRNKFSIKIVHPVGSGTYKKSSAGEKRVINLSFLFAIQSVARERLQSAFNISVLDEALDTLDAGHVEGVFKILKEQARDRTVFVISHNENIKLMFNVIYYVHKANGRSLLSKGK